MSTSTRKKAIDLWNVYLSLEKPEKLALALFRYDNDPDTKEVSGSQDSIGITMPGINRYFYEKGEYWPSKIETISDPAIFNWLEERLYMLTLWPRPANYKVLQNTNINTANVRKLTAAAEKAWVGLSEMNIKKFSEGFLGSL
jgi:hypothetical protein